MQFISKTISTVALFLSCAAALPFISEGNSSLHMLEDRSTPTTLSAPTFTKLKSYVQYAAAAYCNALPSKIGQRITCSNNACPAVGAASVTNYAYLGYNQAEIEGFVGIDSTNKLIVISFKGTTAVSDVVTDLLVPKASCSDLVSGCEAHQGFMYAWEDVKQQTMTAVAGAKTAHPSYNVIVTGHSLGGAVATIAAAYLRKAGTPCDTYTYGSPRVGNDAFASFVSAQAGGNYRVTHTNDPVPRFPSSTLLGFRHTDVEFWLSTGGDTTVDYTTAQVCLGRNNKDCVAKSSNIVNFTPHSYYFQKISACK